MAYLPLLDSLSTQTPGTDAAAYGEGDSPRKRTITRPGTWCGPRSTPCALAGGRSRPLLDGVANTPASVARAMTAPAAAGRCAAASLWRGGRRRSDRGWGRCRTVGANPGPDPLTESPPRPVTAASSCPNLGMMLLLREVVRGQLAAGDAQLQAGAGHAAGHAGVDRALESVRQQVARRRHGYDGPAGRLEHLVG
jgi:hypothetical protein